MTAPERQEIPPRCSRWVAAGASSSSSRAASGGSFLASNLAEHPEVLITPEPLGVRKIHLGAEGQARGSAATTPGHFGANGRSASAPSSPTSAEPDWFAGYLRAQRMHGRAAEPRATT